MVSFLAALAAPYGANSLSGEELGRIVDPVIDDLHTGEFDAGVTPGLARFEL